MLLSAQENPNGVPKEMLEAKKMELRQERVCYEETNVASGAWLTSPRPRRNNVVRTGKKKRG